MVKCPYCGFEGEHRLLKVWKYRWWDSYFYECTRCGGRFRYHIDPRNQKKSFIIKLTGKRPR